jgi:1-hydroxy-2-isopentenylcarotenoid 3,4-desaturase
VREAYADKVIRHVETVTGESIAPHIEVKRIYSHRDFSGDYPCVEGHGAGYFAHADADGGLPSGHAQPQGAEPVFAGQYTHPGIGVPMVMISADVTAGNIQQDMGGASA